MQYHLCEQSDGRIVLDREMHGAVVQTIEVDEPPMDWRFDSEQVTWVQRPAYHAAYEMARAQVKEAGLRYERGEGWFREAVKNGG